MAEALGDMATARKYFEESVTIMRVLVAQKPERIDLTRELSALLNHLGQLAKIAGNGAAARKYFKESVTVLETVRK